MKMTVYAIWDWWVDNGKFYTVVEENEKTLFLSEINKSELKLKKKNILQKILSWFKLIIKEGEIT